MKEEIRMKKEEERRVDLPDPEELAEAVEPEFELPEHLKVQPQT